MVGALIGDCVGRLFEKPRKWLQYVEVDEILSAIRHHMENRKLRECLENFGGIHVDDQLINDLVSPQLQLNLLYLIRMTRL